MPEMVSAYEAQRAADWSSGAADYHDVGMVDVGTESVVVEVVVVGWDGET